MSQNPLENISRKNELLRKLNAEELTMQEFLCECAYWALEDDCFKEIIPEEAPFKPQSFKDWEVMSDKDKNKVDKSFWWDRDIFSYLSERQRIKDKNRYNYEWLKKWKEWIPKEDYVNQEKLNNRIKEFNDFFQFKNSKSQHHFTQEQKQALLCLGGTVMD